MDEQILTNSEIFNHQVKPFMLEFVKMAEALDASDEEIQSGIDLIIKGAALSPNAPPLNEKEERVLGKLQSTPGLVLAHGLGTGKTRTSIQMANQLGMPTNVVVPAPLKNNKKKE